jgi:hypothetical protein
MKLWIFLRCILGSYLTPLWLVHGQGRAGLSCCTKGSSLLAFSSQSQHGEEPSCSTISKEGLAGMWGRTRARRECDANETQTRSATEQWERISSCISVGERVNNSKNLGRAAWSISETIMIFQTWKQGECVQSMLMVEVWCKWAWRSALNVVNGLTSIMRCDAIDWIVIDEVLLPSPGGDWGSFKCIMTPVNCNSLSKPFLRETRKFPPISGSNLKSGASAYTSCSRNHVIVTCLIFCLGSLPYTGMPQPTLMLDQACSTSYFCDCSNDHMKNGIGGFYME